MSNLFHWYHKGKAVLKGLLCFVFSENKNFYTVYSDHSSFSSISSQILSTSLAIQFHTFFLSRFRKQTGQDQPTNQTHKQKTFFFSVPFKVSSGACPFVSGLTIAQGAKHPLRAGQMIAEHRQPVDNAHWELRTLFQGEWVYIKRGGHSREVLHHFFLEHPNFHHNQSCATLKYRKSDLRVGKMPPYSVW